MLSKQGIKLLFDNGQLDELKRELLLYGQVLHLSEWEETKGAYRIYIVRYHTLEWELQMLNGEVIVAGWKPSESLN